MAVPGRTIGDRRLDQRSEILHALMEALLQLVLVRLLVLLDKLSVSLQRVARLLEQLLETKPQLVFVLRGNFPVKQVPAEL